MELIQLMATIPNINQDDNENTTSAESNFQEKNHYLGQPGQQHPEDLQRVSCWWHQDHTG